MLQLIRSADRYTADHGWLRSRFSFSFAEYQDPANVHFGALRVLNDDIIQPSQGFGMHPHREMEIVTYVIDGVLEHRDSMGNRGVIRPGEVQRMTAGTGIFHSEYNHSDNEPVHLLQLWIFPDQKGLVPSWEQKRFSIEQQYNTMLPVVSGSDMEGALRIHQDVTIFLSTCSAGRQIVYAQKPDRRIHLFIIKGSLLLEDGTRMEEGDAARITEQTKLELAAETEAQFMLIDSP